MIGWTQMRSSLFSRGVSIAALLAAAILILPAARSHADDSNARGGAKVRGSHEGMDANERVDEYGIFVPVPVSHPGRRFPAEESFPTGPDVGERLPEFTLKNQNGETIDFHADRAGRKAALVFYRSAVW